MLSGNFDGSERDHFFQGVSLPSNSTAERDGPKARLLPARPAPFSRNTMATRRTRRSKSLAAQSIELGVAVPQVVAHRVARMVIAGASPSARDRAELQRMGTEKIAALNEAWNAMAVQAIRENQKLALSFMQSFWFPWVRPRSSVKSASRRLNSAALGILGKGMAPVRRRAVANAKRLGRAKRR